jgi:membrane associated rhomboid family serine protease
LHGSLAHLLLNMYALWLFGVRLEHRWGSQPFTLYYLTCVVGAALTQLLVAHLNGEPSEIYPTLGASGGVFGVLLAYGLTYPENRIMLLFPPIPMKAKWFVIAYGAAELVFGVTGTAEGIAHFAHLGGMLFGFLLLRYWGRSRR